MTELVPRVLQVVGAMNVAGAETMLMNLYRAIDRERLQFDFLVYSDADGVFDAEIEELGGRLIRVPHPRGRGPIAGIDDVRRVIRSNGPYVAVHAHVLHASAFALRAARLEGVGIRVAHSHNTNDVAGGALRRTYVAWARRTIKRCSTHLVACGSEAGAYLFGSGASWTLVRNGVDLARFAPADAAQRRAARASFGISDDRIVVVSVARFEPVKNHEFLVGLARDLMHQRIDFSMLLAGEGARRSAIEEQVEDFGLAKHVRLLGLQTDVPRLLAAADVVAMPSHYEGIPVALIEAQASGVPCLVSDRVSREVDLGVGLVDFLALEAGMTEWADRLNDLRSRRVGPGTVEHQIRTAGADVADSVERLYRVYQVHP
jgi:glycosyltransferase EpsF